MIIVILIELIFMFRIFLKHNNRDPDWLLFLDYLLINLGLLKWIILIISGLILNSHITYFPFDISKYNICIKMLRKINHYIYEFRSFDLWISKYQIINFAHHFNTCIIFTNIKIPNRMIEIRKYNECIKMLRKINHLIWYVDIN